MKIINRLLLAFATPALISSCSSIDTSDNTRYCANDDGEFYECTDVAIEQTPQVENSTLFRSNIHFQMLSDYAEQMAMDMKNDLRGVELTKPIAVATFVNFDEHLTKTNALGNQLSEYFINEMQSLNVPVMDHKMTGILEVTSFGDFVFSRDLDDLNDQMELGYVLAGTMVQNERGIVVNARIVDVSTNVVVASASKLLPNLLVRNML